MGATVIRLEAARAAMDLAATVARYAEIQAQSKALEAEQKDLRSVILGALGAHDVGALEIANYKVTRSQRRPLDNERAVALLDAQGLADCTRTVRRADQKAAEAAVTLLDGGAWAECFTSMPVLTVREAR